MLRGEPLQRRCNEVATRHHQGETVSALAAEYQVTRATIWNWVNKGINQDLPPLDDRETWRQHLVSTLTDRLTAVQERANTYGDPKDDAVIVKISEALRKIMGLDHTDMINEALIRIEARKLDILATAVERAADAAQLGIEQRVALGHALDRILGELEHKTIEEAS